MNARELIEELQKLDPETTVVIYNRDYGVDEPFVSHHDPYFKFLGEEHKETAVIH